MTGKDIYKVSLIKALTIDVLNNEVPREVGLKFNSFADIENRNLRFKNLLQLAKDWDNQEKRTATKRFYATK